jgi:hypothetical protein
MSPGLISRNGDLRRLRDEGYEVDASNGYLLVSHVPYVNAKKQVAYGTLISTLDLAGDSTVKPTTHVALWAGDYPCDSKGSQLVNLVNNPNVHEKIRDGLEATYSFSQKPAEGYEDYYQKMTAYVQILEGEARVLEPNATAQTFPVISLTEEESVFCYLDSASSRAGITAINEKLKKDRIAIAGLGGTGAYVLDFVAKTLVGEIHLFDGDTFLQHNAFRSPGAPSCDDLKKKPTKVAWFAENYSRMRRKIIPHPQYINETNIAELKPMDFVFLCLDKGGPKRNIVDYLVENKIPFIDVGMGLNIQDGALGGLVRVTTSTPSFHDHLTRRIPFSDGEDNEYSRNIQIADMNALNAALAVVKWKKIWGFYIDLGKEHNTVYGVSTNLVTNEDVPNETKADQT